MQERSADSSQPDRCQTHANVIQTELVTDLARIQPEQWEALVARCPDSTVFQTRGWISSWWTAFAQSHMRLHIVAAYEGGELVGLAPLYQTSRRSLGLHVAELRFVGEGPSDYNLFPVRDGAPEIIDRLVEEVRRELQNNVAIMLADVPQFSPLALCLSAHRGDSITSLRQVSSTPCPRLRLNGNSAGVAALLKKESLRRHYKALSKIGPIIAHHHTAPESIRALLPDLYRQHVARWSGTASPSLFLSAASRQFYGLLADTLGREGKIVLTEVRAGERLAALHFGLRSGGEFIWYKPAFDPALARQGPGEVLLKVLIEQALSEGCSAFDFSRGDETFKTRFATSVDHNATYEWIPRHVPHVLPATARELRRELSRRWKRITSHRRETPSESLRATNKRLLLLDLPPVIAGPLTSLLAREGFEAEVAATKPPLSAQRSARAGMSYDLPSDADSVSAALRRLDQQRQYELLIPFSEELFLSLGALPNDDPLRLKSLVPEQLALTAARQQLPATPLAIYGSDHAADSFRSWTAQCLCAKGRLAWYRVTGNARCAVQRSAWAIPLRARRTLEGLGWHGFATLTFDAAADGRLAVKCFAPLFVPSETEVDALARFIASAWAMIQLRRAPPQPQEFMFSVA